MVTASDCTSHSCDQGPTVREVPCKSALVKSGICDYALNCYTGCQHACRYCYARFMGRFHHPDQPWGSFVDVKLNAPEVLTRQLRRRRTYPGSVFVSSVCDGWQPLESRYRLTRSCLGPLLEHGFELHILTKSSLARRDLDLLTGCPRVLLGVTVTTLDEHLRRQLEPHASPAADRIALLREAARRHIRIYAFFGPLLPGLTDTTANIDKLFAAVADLPLSHIYVDRLNRRWGVWPSLKQWLGTYRPDLLPAIRNALFDTTASHQYEQRLRQRIRRTAARFGLASKLRGLC
ncbi:MAG: radical SAM protein [Phycisphaerae bacterium]